MRKGRLILALAAMLVAGSLAAQGTGEPPRRGIDMNRVEAEVGPPVEKLPPVGNPPITRWRYPGFTVYFEYDRVLHTVIYR